MCFVFACFLLFFIVCVFPFFFLPCGWGAHKSLAPRTRTLVGVLGHATLNFVAVATLLFVVFCECPKCCDLAKQRHKAFWGVSEVGKNNFSVEFCCLYVFFLVFMFFMLIQPWGPLILFCMASIRDSLTGE